MARVGVGELLAVKDVTQVAAGEKEETRQAIRGAS